MGFSGNNSNLMVRETHGKGREAQVSHTISMDQAVHLMMD